MWEESAILDVEICEGKLGAIIFECKLFWLDVGTSDVLLEEPEFNLTCLLVVRRGRKKKKKRILTLFVNQTETSLKPKPKPKFSKYKMEQLS